MFRSFLATILLVGALIRPESVSAEASAGGAFILFENQTKIFDFETPGEYSQGGILQPGNYELSWSASVNTDADIVPRDAFAAYASIVDFSLGNAAGNSAVQRSATAVVSGVVGQPNQNLGALDHAFSPDFRFSESLHASGNGQFSSTISSVSASFSLPQGQPIALNAQGALQTTSSTSQNAVNAGNNGSASYNVDWTLNLSAATAYTVSAIIPVMASGMSQPPNSSPNSPPSFIFTNISDNQWIDPAPVSSYAFKTTDGSLFTKIDNFPKGFTSLFTVWANGKDLGSFGPGQEVDFIRLLGAGVSSFQITGIAPALDGSSSVSFPIQLDFNTPSASFTMTPIPEPSPMAMIGLSLFVLVTAGRCQRSLCVGR